MYGYEVFHEELMDTLIKAVRDGKSPHSFIFEGDAGMGKHIAAELLAASICCGASNSPCGNCKSCVMAKGGTHPDIKHVVPEKDKKSIGVEVMRAVNADTLIKPFFSTKKVYIIEGDLLTQEAQNAFLKTLEEPPLYAAFIIVASDMSKLLQTVISRCAQIHFPGVSASRMKKHLEKSYPGMSSSFPFYISYANGNPGRLDTLLNSSEFSILRDECYKAVSGILSNDYGEAFDVSEFFEQSKEQLTDILDVMMLFLRDILFIQEGMTSMVVNSDYTEKLRSISGVAQTTGIIAAAEAISVCGEMQKRNIGAKYIGMYLALKVKEERR